LHSAELDRRQASGSKESYVRHRWVIVVTLVVGCAAAPHEAQGQTAAAQRPSRPRVGVALGGGSAKGIAHVGVLRWLEEHRVPIDVVAGTSMGGLIGGAYATGMSPDEIEAMLSEVDWDAMFGSSSFQFLNVRRKRDARAYPSHLEFGLKRGLVAPTSLNSGQQVDLLLCRIASPYFAIDSFDQLPTPFRAVAVDLRTARFVVLDRGSLHRAMRATMSLPLIFPPVEIGNQLLVDGGAMNNVPADVARGMGADRVIAVNVGDLGDRTEINRSMLGLVGGTLDAMMRANTLKAVEAADVLLEVPLDGYGSLDWRRYRELIARGYEAAEARKAELLPFAVDEGTWQQWHDARASARSKVPVVPTFVDVEGAARADTDVMRTLLAPHIGRPVEVAEIERDITLLGGLDRYQSLVWTPVRRDGADGLRLDAQPKAYGPPFVYLGMSLENTTGNDFRFGLSGRYLAFDVAGSGSELRLDAALGSDPSVGLAFYRPLWGTSLFVEPLAGVRSTTLSAIRDDEIVASYKQTRNVIGVDVGANLGRLDEVRVGALWGRLDTSVEVGDPGLPELGGQETRLHADWTHDGQDSPIVPSRGTRVRVRLEHYLDAPEPPAEFETTRATSGVTQAEVSGSWFHSLAANDRHRLFFSGGAGTSFDGSPLPSEQFALGGPLRLGAFSVGEQRGDHYVQGAGGYLHRAGRLPDFLGGPVFLGAWLETGSAFDAWDTADGTVHTTVGVILDSLLGPVFASYSTSFSGQRRFYFGIGQIFR
jgi:NTE family protein